MFVGGGIAMVQFWTRGCLIFCSDSNYVRPPRAAEYG